ncbi:histidine phosphotransferase family protein [uncultured Sphingomonas sp.]|uniref:histidine phosphotransferase family protein n=1 Tax=uncultured Sphingomonas sp. TaxID=158754 RepID=UPI0025FF1C1A|nr:histidine phosphotransferase family protein [uncultured Sphingomonas sp.]
MSNASVEFASLLCSRLCHDLLSPVGALMNGLELLADEEDPAMRERVMELLAESARTSADKLKFFRLAFGSAGGFGEEVAAEEVRAALAGLVRGNSRVELLWLVEQPGIAKDAAKILLNLGMVALDALVRGGRLMAAVEDGEVVVRAEGARIVMDAEIREVLSGGGNADAINSRTSAAWLLRKLAEDNGRTLQLAEEEGLLLLAASHA